MEFSAISKAEILSFRKNFIKLYFYFEALTRDTNLVRFAYVTKVYDLDRSEEYVSK